MSSNNEREARARKEAQDRDNRQWDYIDLLTNFIKYKGLEEELKKFIKKVKNSNV